MKNISKKPTYGYIYRIIGYGSNGKAKLYAQTRDETSAKEQAAKMVLGDGYAKCQTASIYDKEGIYQHSVSRTTL